MRGLHADRRHPRGRQHAARHRELEAEDRGGTDEAVAVIGADRTVGLEGRLPGREVLVAQALTERHGAGLEEGARVAVVGSDVDLHGVDYGAGRALSSRRCSPSATRTSAVTGRR
jgi:hypothetical protein